VNRLWLTLACVLAALTATSQTNRPGPPNIVFILAEDLGWSDAGFAGSRFYETPQLDALAAAGLRFTGFYVSPTDTGTRAALLTGQYEARTGLYAGEPLVGAEASPRRLSPPRGRTQLPDGIPLLPELLKTAGYVTGFLGTWPFAGGETQHPSRRGFDEALVTSPRYFGFETEPPTDVPAGSYAADFLTERAVDFIARHRERPFFLHVAHVSVRGPVEPKPATIGRFEKKAPAGGHRDAAYAAAITSLDESVGRIVERIRELGLDRNTLVIFSSDNGGAGGYVETENSGRRTGVTDNAPLRGGKGMLYEGGLRVPFLLRWPGVIPPGSRTIQPGIHVDLLPTCCEVAGVRPPAGAAIDGVSLLPLLRDPAGHLGRDAIFWHFPGYIESDGRAGWRTTPVGVVRAGNFKLLEFFEEGRLELYNLTEDLGEKSNLVRSLPEKAKELRDKLAAWRTQIGAPMPEPKAAAPPAAAAAPPPSGPAAAPPRP
jgi:arylsulfatase A-like enzyme